MPCPHCRDLPDVFDEKLAARELRRYRRKGPSKTTRMLVDALRQHGASGRTVLDVGGGVGAVLHELLAAGAHRAFNVDAAATYQAAARAEAARRGMAERIEFYLGDFVEMEGGVPAADLVTLDRVICCYPDMPALVDASAAHARALWGAVFPRDRRATRWFIEAFSLFQRLRGKAFRVYLHPPGEIGARLEARGFVRAFHRATWLWHVEVWRRERPQSPAAGAGDAVSGLPA